MEKWCLKNKFNKSLFFISLFLFSAFYFHEALAMPSAENYMKLSQPSGSEFLVKRVGDEWFNYYLSQDGYILTKDSNGFFCYSYLDNYELKSLEERYSIDLPSSEALKHADIRDKNLGVYYRNKKKGVTFKRGNLMESTLPHLYNSSYTQDIKPIMDFERNILVILVEFQDRELSYGEEKWQDLFFSDRGKSVKSYYKEVSGGKLNFNAAKENYGQANDGIVKVKLDRNHPNFKEDFGGEDGPRELVREALIASDTYVDYSVFDENKDRYISKEELNIILVVAGYDSSVSYDKSPGIWAHSWSLPSSSLELDGIKDLAGINCGYTMQGEMHYDHQATLGVFCHEIGHILGLPDLYDTDYSSQGVGIHSLMGSGGWGKVKGESSGETPTHLDAWSKVKLGLINPKTILNNGEYSLRDFSYGGDILKIPTDTIGEYFLVENRQFKGFDRGLSDSVKSGGIAIWHIDDNVVRAKNSYNTVNDDENHKGVDLEEADEAIVGRRNLDQPFLFDKIDSYFRAGFVSKFNKDTLPNSRLYSGKESNVSIEIKGGTLDSINVQVSLAGGDEDFIPEDLNGDGVVNFEDLNIILNYYNLTKEEPLYSIKYDLNKDGIIDIYDVVLISNKIKEEPHN